MRECVLVRVLRGYVFVLCVCVHVCWCACACVCACACLRAPAASSRRSHCRTFDLPPTKGACVCMCVCVCVSVCVCVGVCVCGCVRVSAVVMHVCVCGRVIFCVYESRLQVGWSVPESFHRCQRARCAEMKASNRLCERARRHTLTHSERSTFSTSSGSLIENSHSCVRQTQHADRPSAARNGVYSRAQGNGRPSQMRPSA